jgi:hypothetical protein
MPKLRMDLLQGEEDDEHMAPQVISTFAIRNYFKM